MGSPGVQQPRGISTTVLVRPARVHGAGISAAPGHPGAGISAALGHPGAGISAAPGHPGAGISASPGQPGAGISADPGQPGAGISAAPEDPATPPKGLGAGPGSRLRRRGLCRQLSGDHLPPGLISRPFAARTANGLFFSSQETFLSFLKSRKSRLKKSCGKVKWN
ncbi:hypothetical protein AMQ83_10925 [Paenibacillus riograndensis]|nr:hypothetical protein AMQ83_10925 [Paenibacillus riograndensis]